MEVKHCKSIAIDRDFSTWLIPEIDKTLYEKYRERFKERLSNGICPPCIVEHYSNL